MRLMINPSDSDVNRARPLARWRGSVARLGLLPSECPLELVASHLGAAGQVSPLGLAVELLARLRLGRPGALALRHGRALLAERRTGLRRHVGDRLLVLRSFDRLAYVAFGGLALLGRRHRRLLSLTALGSSARSPTTPHGAAGNRILRRGRRRRRVGSAAWSA